MNAFDSFEDKDFEKLNQAILKAIISSQDVEKVLEDFKSKDLINEMAVVNLILSLEELTGLMFSEQTDKRTHTFESAAENQTLGEKRMGNQVFENNTNNNSHVSSSHYLVDGKVLSQNEILFEKYYQGKFNEKQWLKRAKIKR